MILNVKSVYVVDALNKLFFVFAELIHTLFKEVLQNKHV